MPASPVRHRILRACAATAFIVVCNCLNSMESGNKTARPASCSECHPLAASKFCDTTAMTYQNETWTRCSFCHLGSIKLDSTMNIYHDRMMPAEDGLLPVTGNLHANGRIDLQFGQCTMCHDYPPMPSNNPNELYAHYTHVGLDKMQCFECHVYSVQCSTDRHPNPSNPSDTVDTLIQIMRGGIGGQMIPAANGRAHLNNRVDVAFRKRAEDSLTMGDTFDRNLYIWDNYAKTCYNMKGCGCHLWLGKKGPGQ